MRAWAVVENGQPLKEIELPTPEPTGTEVLLEVTHCGVCHSDLHIWEGYYDLGGGQKMSLVDRGVVLPLAMGHEIVGRVAKLGPDAKGVKVGDLRIVYPLAGLRQMREVPGRGRQHVLGRGAQPRRLSNGGYGTHVVAPHPRHLVDPGTLDPAVAATYACSGITVFSAIKKAMPLTPTQPIVLVGAGGLGLNAIAVLKAMKHQNIISVDVSAEKREAALKAGAHKAVDGSGDGRAVTKRIIEAAGGPVYGGDRSGERHRHRALRLRRAGQGRQADSGRPVRRRTDAAAADHGDPSADRARELCRQSEGTAGTGEAGAGW